MIPGEKSKMHFTEDRRLRPILTILAKVQVHVLRHKGNNVLFVGLTICYGI